LERGIYDSSGRRDNSRYCYRDTVRSTGEPYRLVFLLYMVPTHAFFSLLGAVAACLALARRERWVPLSLIALTVNGIPFLMMLGLIAQKVRF